MKRKGEASSAAPTRALGSAQEQTDEQRDNSRKGQAEGSHLCRPVFLIPSGDLCSRRVRGQICSPQSSHGPCIVSCVSPSPSEGAAHSPELAPTHSLPLPQRATACSSCRALNLGSPQPNKLNLSPKGAWAVFYKQRLHKSCLSPSRLTLFSLPPHLLLAKWLNSFSIYCGSLKPKPRAWGRMQNSSALWPLPSGGAGNCLLPLLCNPASITLLNPWRKQLQKKIFVLWQAHVCTFPALEVLN